MNVYIYHIKMFNNYDFFNVLEWSILGSPRKHLFDQWNITEI